MLSHTCSTIVACVKQRTARDVCGDHLSIGLVPVARGKENCSLFELALRAESSHLGEGLVR